MKKDHLEVQLESLHLCPQLPFQILLAARQSLWLPPMSEIQLSVDQTSCCLLLAVADPRLANLKQSQQDPDAVEQLLPHHPAGCRGDQAHAVLPAKLKFERLTLLTSGPADLMMSEQLHRLQPAADGDQMACRQPDSVQHAVPAEQLAGQQHHLVEPAFEQLMVTQGLLKARLAVAEHLCCYVQCMELRQDEAACMTVPQQRHQP